MLNVLAFLLKNGALHDNEKALPLARRFLEDAKEAGATWGEFELAVALVHGFHFNRSSRESCEAFADDGNGVLQDFEQYIKDTKR